MSFTLTSFLLHTMSLYDDRWSVYARMAIPIHAYPWSVLVLAVIMASDASFPEPRAFVFLGAWVLMFHSVRIYKSMHGVWTFGEWTVVTCILAVALSETVACENVGLDQAHHIVAATGTLGCLVACAVAAKIPSVAVRIPVLVGTPLAFVEGAMHWHRLEFPAPRCINWLLDFLLGYEIAASPGLPRVTWVLYWVATLIIMVPVSALPRFLKLAPTVVMRKWFHLMAIILFTPVTLLSPQLMMLSYAVALCGLMVVECIRPLLPKPIQDFYLGLSDTEKDKPGCVIISHMALISGCAFPFWLSGCIGEDSKLLKLWGVMALGVGDSFGAIVGSSWGKTKWGWGRTRSLEGSLAMVISLSICCSLLREPCLVAVVFATLLEAFTSQIDNLVLPLAGAALLMFLSAKT